MTGVPHPLVSNRRSLLIAALGLGVAPAKTALAVGPAITTYGTRDAQAPAQLGVFSFLVGKWQGSGKSTGQNGGTAHFDVTWIGRYMLNGWAIADEFQSRAPDGSPYLGISLRYFDVQLDSWIVEYLNVSGSFIRRQVNPGSGSVRREGNTVVVISEDLPSLIRERYRLLDDDHFIYSTDMSHDHGRTWQPASIEVSLERTA